MELLKRLYRTLKYLRVTQSFRKAWYLSKFRGISSGSLCLNRSRRLVLCGTEVDVEVAGREFLLTGIRLIEDLRRHVLAQFTVSHNGDIVLTVRGIRLILRSWEEVFIAHEIFRRGIYNIVCDQEFHVIDIGANIGASALFFASQSTCSRVDSFELFKETAGRAEDNLSINPDLKAKIRIYQYGLGPESKKTHVEYCAEFKGSIGVDGVPAYAYPHGATLVTEKVEVEIRNAAPVVADLLAAAGDKKVVCKLDCEGSEYGIIRSLSTAGLIPLIDIFMIEWHQFGPEEIKRDLRNEGFICLSFDECSPMHGMLYAFGPRSSRAVVRHATD